MCILVFKKEQICSLEDSPVLCKLIKRSKFSKYKNDKLNISKIIFNAFMANFCLDISVKRGVGKNP